MNETNNVPFSFIDNPTQEQETGRKMYRFYVGIDIGASFHVASCIPFNAFLDPKG